MSPRVKNQSPLFYAARPPWRFTAPAGLNDDRATVAVATARYCTRDGCDHERSVACIALPPAQNRARIVQRFAVRARRSRELAEARRILDIAINGASEARIEAARQRCETALRRVAGKNA